MLQSLFMAVETQSSTPNLSLWIREVTLTRTLVIFVEENLPTEFGFCLYVELYCAQNHWLYAGFRPCKLAHVNVEQHHSHG